MNGKCTASINYVLFASFFVFSRFQCSFKLSYCHKWFLPTLVIWIPSIFCTVPRRYWQLIGTSSEICHLNIVCLTLGIIRPRNIFFYSIWHFDLTMKYRLLLYRATRQALFVREISKIRQGVMVWVCISFMLCFNNQADFAGSLDCSHISASNSPLILQNKLPNNIGKVYQNINQFTLRSGY